MRIALQTSSPLKTERWTSAIVCASAVAVLMVAAVSSGCATTKAAAAVTTGPPLTVPQPPPRVLVPPEEEPLVATGPGLATPVLAPRATPPPLPAVRRNVAARSEAEPRGSSEQAPPATTTVLGNAPAETPLELKPLPSPTDPSVDAQGVLTTL